MSVNPFESRHYKALTRLKPLPMDAEDYAIAKELDRALEAADQAHQESFASTCDATLERWEDAYGLGHSGTKAERKAALMAAVNRQWGISARHYQAIAEQMGFDIIITSPPRMFRAEVSRAGFPCYYADELYTWNVTVMATEEDADVLVKEFEAQKIPFTLIRWTYNPTVRMECSMAVWSTMEVE